MFEKFMMANAGDFRQRYEGTFGFYRDEKGKRMLSKLTAIGGNICEFTDARGVVFKLNANSDKDIGFEFIPPKSQFYNTDEDTFYVRRLAARQFQRGVSNKNVEIFRLVGDTLMPQRVDFQTLGKVYEQTRTPAEILGRFTAGGLKRNGFALSNSIAFGFKGVYVFDRLVGTYDSKDYQHFRIALDEPELWRTEIIDALRRLNKTAEVK